MLFLFNKGGDWSGSISVRAKLAAEKFLQRTSIVWRKATMCLLLSLKLWAPLEVESRIGCASVARLAAMITSGEITNDFHLSG